MAELERVSAQEAAELVEAGYCYLDVRTQLEFAAGHPRGAHNIPYLERTPAGMQPNADFLKVVEANYEKDVRLLVGCQAGRRSLSAARILMDAGYHVVELRSGFGGLRDPFGRIIEPGWATAGLPVDSGDDEGSYVHRRAKAGL